MSKIALNPPIKNKKQLLILISVFLAVQLVFVWCMYHVRFSLFSYICILTSCLFCAVLSDGSQSALFTQIGLLGTVGADFFLVLLPDQQRVPGMCFFCVTQIAYFLRIYTEDGNPKRKRVHLILRTSLSAVLVAATFLVLGSRVDAVAVLSLFYYANLFCNVLFSLLHFRKSRILALALLSFLLSDTLLGLSCLRDYFLIPRGSLLWAVIAFGSDIFYPLYIISQISVPLSLASRKGKQIQRLAKNQK